MSIYLCKNVKAKFSFVTSRAYHHLHSYEEWLDNGRECKEEGQREECNSLRDTHVAVFGDLISGDTASDT
jgi:hypothetical protein